MVSAGSVNILTVHHHIASSSTLHGAPSSVAFASFWPQGHMRNPAAATGVLELPSGDRSGQQLPSESFQDDIALQ